MTDNTNATVPTNAAKLAELQKLLASFSAAELKDALKSVTANKQTILSVTMDCIVAAQLRGKVITADVTKEVTRLGRERGVLSESEDARETSVAQLIRHSAAHDDAMTRAGYEWSKKAAAETEPTSDGPAPPASDGSAAPEPAKPEEPAKVSNYRDGKKAA